MRSRGESYMFGRMEASGRLTLACLAALVLALVGIAGMAQAQQTWHFSVQDAEPGCPVDACHQMVEGEDQSSDTVPVNVAETHLWVADESVTTVDAVNFGQEDWSLHLGCTVDGLSSDQIDVRLGHLDAELTFVAFDGATAAVTCEGDIAGVLAGGVTQTISPDEDVSIPEDSFLALQVENPDGDDVDVIIGDDDDGQDFSALESPDSDPGYPAWEATSVVLLGAGILAVVGWTRFRRPR